MKIALFKATGAISLLIKWQTRSEYSHAAVILDDGTVYEAREFKGVRKVQLSETQGKAAVDIFDVPTTPEQDAKIIEYLESQLGKKYDYLSVLRFISRRKEAQRSKDDLFCSEYVFSGFSCAAVILLERIEAFMVSPALLGISPIPKYLFTVHPGQSFAKLLLLRAPSLNH